MSRSSFLWRPFGASSRLIARVVFSDELLNVIARISYVSIPLRFPIQTTRRKAWQKKKFNDSERNKRKVLNLRGNIL